MHLFVVGTVIAVLAFVVSGRPDTDSEHAHGCFVSRTAGPVLIAPGGIHLPSKSGLLVTPYELEWAKGYKLAVLGSVSLVDGADGYLWEQSDRGWSYTFRFEGPGGFMAKGAVDPEKLDAFRTIDQDGNRVDFVRTASSMCDAIR